MHTACFSSSGGSAQPPVGKPLDPLPQMQTPLCRQIPLQADPPSVGGPPGCRPVMHAGKLTPLDAGHVTCNACWEANPTGCWSCDLWCILGTKPPVNKMTHTCKNIDLPQTSFAGGKIIIIILEQRIFHERRLSTSGPFALYLFTT